MLGRHDSQGNFFDLEIFSKMIPKDHPLVQIKEKVDFSFVTEAVKHLYDPEKVDPAFPLRHSLRYCFLKHGLISPMSRSANSCSITFCTAISVI